MYEKINLSKDNEIVGRESTEYSEDSEELIVLRFVSWATGWMVDGRDGDHRDRRCKITYSFAKITHSFANM